MNSTPIFIMAGGRGSRLGELTTLTPKPMVKIGGVPILQHVMDIYMRSGFSNFHVATGHLHEVIENYFLRRRHVGAQGNIMISREGRVASETQKGYSLNLAYTGLGSGTAHRTRKLREFAPGGTCMLTYGDGLADVNISTLLEHHKKSVEEKGVVATITAVRPYSRFGVLEIEDGLIVGFREKPQADEWVNIGFMVLEPPFFDYLKDAEQKTMLEEVLPVVSSDGKLGVYKHEGTFRAMDTYKDFEELNRMWDEGKAFWTQ